MKKLLFVFAWALVVGPAFRAGAQVPISYNTAYNQNFDSLNGISSWSNNTTLTGWYAQTTATSNITSIGSNTGSTTTAGLYSFGVAGTNALSERALGFSTTNAFTGSGGANYMGVRLTNSSIYTLSSLTVKWDGEEWRRMDNTATQQLVLQYSLDATSLTTGTWTAFTLNSTFTSPQVGSSQLALDGNAAANRVANITSSVAGIGWAPGTTVWVRWFDINDSGNDHMLTIDNVQITAVPEPHDYGIAFGGLFVAVIILRRRRQQMVD